MKVAAIITEYNPFHRGHAYQLTQIRADFVMVIMSGNFVQRGEPAFVDKWTRTQMALANGVDLVLELPGTAAVGSAEYFARGAVFLLEQSKIVSQLCFGAEHPHLFDLQELATILHLESGEFSAHLQASLKKGNSFATARQEAIERLFPNFNYGTILKGSNNILAIEYLKALRFYQSEISPFLIPRKGQDYLDDTYQKGLVMSATAIRKITASAADPSALSDALPLPSYLILKQALQSKKCPVYPADIYPYIRLILLRSSKEELLSVRDINPDLLHRLLKGLGQNLDYDAYVDFCCTRNFPAAKVKRALLHIFLKQFPPQAFTVNNSYLKILGFRRSAAPLLRLLQEKAVIPVVTNTRNSKELSPQAYLSYQAELQQDKIYAEILANKYGVTLPSPEQINPVIVS